MTEPIFPPIVMSALGDAGPMAKSVARNLQRGFHPDRYEAACHLSDALCYDGSGHWRIDDTHIERDRGYSVDARQAANGRRAWRTALSDQIARLDDDAFAALLDRLADATVKAA